MSAAIVVTERTVTVYATLDDLLAAHQQVGATPATGSLRAELRGQPRLAGLVGPMWGGADHPLRYESTEMNRHLSL